MKSVFIPLLACLSIGASAGNVTVAKDICYATTKGYWPSMDGVGQNMAKAVCKGIFKTLGKRDFNLTLDLYSPEDLSEKRPLIVFIHGGTFYFGSKEEESYVDFCRYFASLGYVTASINYSLGYRFNEKDVNRAKADALGDSRKALDFLAENADEFHIDPDCIFVAGSSSGAFSALGLAYNSDGAERNYRIRAVANMWGWVTDPDIMLGSNASVVSFHGDNDSIVPYYEGYPMPDLKLASKLFPGKMYGSACIDQKAEELGLRHRLYTFPGEGHALNKDKNNKTNDNHEFIKGKIAEFFLGEVKSFSD